MHRLRSIRINVNQSVKVKERSGKKVRIKKGNADMHFIVGRGTFEYWENFIKLGAFWDKFICI